MTDSEPEAFRRREGEKHGQEALDDIAEYAETHDFAQEIAGRGVWASHVESDLTVTTSLWSRVESDPTVTTSL